VWAFGGKEMNKLAVIMPIYQRHELTTLALKNLWHQWNKYGIDVFVVGSEGEASKELVSNFGFNYLEYANNPISAKLNAVLNEAKGYDGVIVLGSDNFISDSIIEHYQTVDCSISAVYGFDDIHFYSTHLKRLATKSSYNSMRMSVGVGRLMTKKLLEAANYNIWNEAISKGLDTSASNRIALVGGQHIKIEYKKEYFMLDVKHELNLTNHDIIKTCRVNCDLSLIDKHLPRVYSDILNLNINDKIKTMKKTLKQRPNVIPKVAIEVIKEIAGMKVGDTRNVPNKLAQQAIANGWAKLRVEAKEVIEPKKSFTEKLEKTIEKKATKKSKK
jgi:predicted HAD superfamily phosphohydrolase YqeG